MVARLKLKGIDGRAPPGVNVALAPVAQKWAASRTGDHLLPCPATPSNCWKTLKPCIPRHDWKQHAGQVNNLGYGDNCSG